MTTRDTAPAVRIFTNFPASIRRPTRRYKATLTFNHRTQYEAYGQTPHDALQNAKLAAYIFGGYEIEVNSETDPRHPLIVDLQITLNAIKTFARLAVERLKPTTHKEQETK